MGKVYNGILRDKNNNKVHPETNSKQVYCGNDNEIKLQEKLDKIDTTLQSYKEAEKDKGYFESYNQLISIYPNNIDDATTRKGWKATIGGNEDAIYIWDIEGNEWKTSSLSIDGIQEINGLTGKKVTLTGNDIKSTMDNFEDTIQGHLNRNKDSISLAYEKVEEIKQDLSTTNETLKEKANKSDIPDISNLASIDYVNENGGKIDAIQVNGILQTINDKIVNIKTPIVPKHITSLSIIDLQDNIYKVTSSYPYWDLYYKGNANDNIRIYGNTALLIVSSQSSTTKQWELISYGSQDVGTGLIMGYTSTSGGDYKLIKSISKLADLTQDDNNMTITKVEKNKLNSLSNYDDTNVKALIENVKKSKLEYKGQYSSTTSYIVNDMIFYGNMFFICIKECSNIAPLTSSNTTYWVNICLLSDKANKDGNGNDISTTYATKDELSSVEDLAKQKNQGLSFANYSDMISNLNNSTKDDYNKNDSIYILTTSVPDLWVYNISDTNVTYTYTNDEDFTKSLKDNGSIQVGYYILGALESGKVDLENYVTNDTFNTQNQQNNSTFATKVELGNVSDNIPTKVGQLENDKGYLINAVLSFNGMVGDVDVVIPTQLTQLSEDTTHRLVTDSEKANWNNKASKGTTLSDYGIEDAYIKSANDLSGDYRHSIHLGGQSVVMPKYVSELQNDKNYVDPDNLNVWWIHKVQAGLGFAGEDDVENLSQRVEQVKNSIPTKLSQLSNDKGYITKEELPPEVEAMVVDATLNTTSTNAIQNKAVATAVNGLFNSINDVAGMVGNVDGKLANYYNKEEIDEKEVGIRTTIAFPNLLYSPTINTNNSTSLTPKSEELGDDYNQIINLHKVSKTGSYNDLLDKPTIPSIIGLASETYVDNKVASVVNSAPEALNTLQELSKALGDDPNFATTITTEIGKKATKSTTLSGYGITDAKISNGTITLGSNTIKPLTSFTESDPTVPSWAKESSKPTYTWTEITNKPTFFSGSYNDLTNKPTLFSGNYNDLTNKPTIPTVNNGTLTIQRNGTTIKTFTANSSSNVTANIEVPTTMAWTSITGKPTFFSGSYNDLTNKPTIPDVSAKLEASNIIAGTNITITKSGNNVTINSSGGSSGATITQLYSGSVKLGANISGSAFPNAHLYKYLIICTNDGTFIASPTYYGGNSSDYTYSYPYIWEINGVTSSGNVTFSISYVDEYEYDGDDWTIPSNRWYCSNKAVYYHKTTSTYHQDVSSSYSSYMPTISKIYGVK